MLLDGLHVPLTVPFHRDGRLFAAKLEANVARFSKTPAAGLIVLGPGSEANGLTDAESGEVLAAVARAAAHEKVLIAGVSRDSVRASLEAAQVAFDTGFDAVLAESPHQLQGDSAEEAMVYFRALADASPLPVVVGSGFGSRALPVEWVAELARHANLIGMVDADLIPARFAEIAAATASVKREVEVTAVFAAVTRRMRAAGSGLVTLGQGTAQPMLKTRTKSVGFQVLAAGSTDMLPVLRAGASGAAPVLAACAPQACYEVYAAWKDGDDALAAQKADRILVASQLLAEELGVAGVKYGCDLNGYYGGAPRLPRLPLNAAGRERVEAALREIPS